jgi:hypothetical protein
MERSAKWSVRMQNLTHDLPPPQTSTAESSAELTPREKRRRRRLNSYWALITLIAFVTGSVGGYFLGSQKHREMGGAQADMANLVKQINPPEGYTVSATLGDIGPRLLEAGAMKAGDFIQVYEQAGQPLNNEQLAILQQGSLAQVVFNQENAYYLLNFFWALGLTNDNPVLTEGSMVREGRANVVNYASTGGWSLAAKPVRDLYASAVIVKLTPKQQARLEEVVKEIYRPCCDNSTYFPDCNHGMAMLGLMELMASHGASVDEMFQAAKYANAYWYPQQSLELATYFKEAQRVNFDQADPRQLISQRFSSISGFQTVHQWLSTNGLLQQAPGGANNCGV